MNDRPNPDHLKARFVAELPQEVYERWTVEMEAETGHETAPEERVH